ncbi:hypothetical protein DKX38_018913 [Salix brachista]|uniref:Cytochrome P450 n=1 Tax=Salix brachista TaxID=2182728 RepID=A0A5N5KPD9_9ROSI|nr:hypothetical protein DKX38_018913 [Salix brachista]
MGENVVVMTGEASHRFIFSGRDNGIAAKLATSALAILGKNNIFDLHGSPHKLVRSSIMSFLNFECIQRCVSKMDSLVKEQVLQISFIATYGESAFWITRSEGKRWNARGRIFKLFTNLIAKRKRGLEDGSMGSHDDVILCLLSLRDENGKTLPPPIIGNFRHAWRDTTFNSYDIPKGCQVFWLATSTHLDSKKFEDPVKFNPSRFDTNPKSSDPPCTYLPFGAGPRVCPGADFARTEVLLIIHHLITNYKWTAMVEDELVVRDPMPFPNKGLPVKIYPNHM